MAATFVTPRRSETAKVSVILEDDGKIMTYCKWRERTLQAFTNNAGQVVYHCLVGASQIPEKRLTDFNEAFKWLIDSRS